jgi:hypothetical protein
MEMELWKKKQADEEQRKRLEVEEQMRRMAQE